MRLRTARLARAGRHGEAWVTLDADLTVISGPSRSSTPDPVRPSTLLRGLRPPTTCYSSLTRLLRPVCPSCSGCARASSHPPVAGVRTVTSSDAGLVSCSGEWWCSAVSAACACLQASLACLRSRARWRSRPRYIVVKRSGRTCVASSMPPPMPRICHPTLVRASVALAEDRRALARAALGFAVAPAPCSPLSRLCLSPRVAVASFRLAPRCFLSSLHGCACRLPAYPLAPLSDPALRVVVSS
ncbi:hypothetical protein BD310DRAFT_121634 [Dichomitus squalens]|uniref:Uncharacterized protein n=1 Tax=Dichomitus squalens TaxID=114155 RepID=A0A4Q9Q4G1_9APHY|nr:hypothetical protein BD310DRAFT_121634 [Dichomitus squalens]